MLPNCSIVVVASRLVRAVVKDNMQNENNVADPVYDVARVFKGGVDVLENRM